MTMPSAQLLSIAEIRFVPHPSGALYWPSERTLLVADLHLEKGSAFARRGQFLPPYDTDTTLHTLETTLDAFPAERVVALGDSFHDGGGPGRLSAACRARLMALTARYDWVWITGNHDPVLPADLGGTFVPAWQTGAITCVHEPTGAGGELAGHLHPCATVRVRGRRVRRRCFVTDGARAVLPSFGAYTGGLDVGEAPWTALFPGPFEAWMLGGNAVYPVSHARLRA